MKSTPYKKQNSPDINSSRDTVEYYLAAIIAEVQNVREFIDDEHSEADLRLASILHCVRTIWDFVPTVDSIKEALKECEPELNKLKEINMLIKAIDDAIKATK